MPEPFRALAGDCTVVHDRGADRSEYRGNVLALLKPDNTVLVHDADGYQPVAWLTRADAVSFSRDGAFAVVAHADDETLRVVAHVEHGVGRYPASEAGMPVGECPNCDCDAPLVRSPRGVSCVACDERYGLPSGGSVRDEDCDCGLPRVRVERGLAFDVCLDRGCEPLDDAVAGEFDRRWDCPDCGADLRVLRRGGLLVGCDDYPDCEVAFSFPTGLLVGDCPCGLPLFETGGGRRCLDATCEAFEGEAGVEREDGGREATGATADDPSGPDRPDRHSRP